MTALSETHGEVNENTVYPFLVLGGGEKVEETQETPENRDKWTYSFKVIKTICLWLTWVCMGLYSGITGPTVPDLSERLQTKYDSIGFAIAFKSFGKMTGSIIFGYLRDRWGSRGDLLLACALFLVAISVVTKPWVTTISALAFLFFFEGVPHGGMNAVGNSMCVLMWKDRAAMPVHFLHFGYGVGALLSPLIASPFLSQYATVNISISNISDTFQRKEEIVVHQNLSYTKMTTVVIEQSKIEIPYAIVSAVITTVGLIYLALYCHSPSRKLTSQFGRDSYSNPCSAPFLRDRPKTALPILALFFFFYMITSLIDKSLSSFLFTYAVESGIGFTKREAAYLNTAFFGCYATGRVIFGLVAFKLPVKILLFVEVYLMTACSSVITFYAFNKKIFLWVFSCSLALFFGPIFPSGVAWVDRYVALYGLVVAIFDVGNGVGAFIANWLSGSLITKLGTQSLVYLNFIAACVLSCIIIIAQVIGTIRGDRHLKAANVETTAEYP